jgi:transglutaminase-like putative cysteine protease/uncharacterized membrane protein
MFERWRAFLAKHQTAPEESVAYRTSVTVLVMFCLVLTLHQLEWPNYWPAVLLITPGASVLSYYRRKDSNIGLKIFLSFAMVALLLWFFVRLARTLYDPRLPLAELLVWLQTLHAFDLPAKKDLRYTGLVALILIAISAVLTYSSYFGPLLLVFCLLFLAVLAVDFWAGNRTPETIVHRGDARHMGLNPRWLGSTVLKTLPLAILGAALIFLFMPRYQGLTLRSLPLNWDIQFSLSKISGGEVMNQLSNPTNIDTGGQPQKIDGDSYFGFNSEVNLNARGQLSDRVVLKVRTSNWQYHRGVTFSKYTGYGWKGFPWKPVTRTIAMPPFFFPSVNWQDERVTIYYAETDLPNIIFTPSTPRRVYFPSSEIFEVTSFEKEALPKDSLNTPATLVSPFFLEEGVVYSVLNQLPATGPSVLSKKLSQPFESEPAEFLAPFLELPDTVTQRTRERALEITREQHSDWARAAALTAFLQQNYSYRLDTPFYPEKADTADHFLFESKIGYCEQFATTLCVMARSVGLPARYVTGYLPGTFNPISGFYEIKASDAHAWTEIYFDDYGWMIFDPVPGGNANPQVGESPQQKWLFESLLEYLNVPDDIRGALPNLVRLFVGLALLSLALTLWRRSRRGVEEQKSPFGVYLHEAESLTENRQPGETVKSWSQRLTDYPELEVLARVYQERFYRDLPLQEVQEQELAALIEKLKAKRHQRSHDLNRKK